MTSMGATEPAAPAASASPPSAAPGQPWPDPPAPAAPPLPPPPLLRQPLPPPPPAPVLTPGPPAAPADRRLGYHPALDGLRGVALAIVVLHHAALLMWPSHPEWFFRGGQVGLDVFFALSGFLITALLLGEHRKRGTVRVGNFLWRRLLRLWPALVGLQVGMLVASVATDRYPPGEVLESSARSLAFATNLDAGAVLVEVGHTWSMSVEAHFYLLWCVVVAVVAARVRRPYPILAALAGLGVVLPAVARALAFTDDGGVTAWQLYVHSAYRLDGPFVGALLGVAWVAGWTDRIPSRWAVRAVPVALVALGLLVARTHPLSPTLFRGLFTVAAGLGAVVVLGALQGGTSPSVRLLAWRPVVLTGTISYSIYLWHLPVIMFLDRNTSAWPPLQQMALAVAASLVLGALSYRYVERPFLRRKAKVQADG